MANANLSATLNVTSRDITMYYEPYEFLALQPALSILLITTLVIASIVGSSGNIFILIAIATQRDLHTVESIFIANLACSDLYVTLIADPLSIVGKLGFRCAVFICYSHIGKPGILRNASNSEMTVLVTVLIRHYFLEMPESFRHCPESNENYYEAFPLMPKSI